MKLTKIFSITGILSLAAASSVLAADLTIGTGTTVTIKPSKNVTVTYAAGADSVGPPAGTAASSYGIATIHASGTKTFGSTSGDTKIFMKDGITGNTVTAPAVTNGVPAAGTFTGWSEM